MERGSEGSTSFDSLREVVSLRFAFSGSRVAMILESSLGETSASVSAPVIFPYYSERTWSSFYTGDVSVTLE